MEIGGIKQNKSISQGRGVGSKLFFSLHYSWWTSAYCNSIFYCRGRALTVRVYITLLI